MKNDFISIIQKCTCIDFMINTLINTNSYNYLNCLSDMKEENLRNIKIMCYLYEYLSKDVLPIDDITSLKINKYSECDLNILLEFNLKVLSKLETLKKYVKNTFYYQILIGLINSYLSFISSIHCVHPINTTSDKSQFKLFNPVCSKLKDKDQLEVSTKYLRSVSIDAIKFFFNNNLLEKNICDEYYKVFFENNSESKFYQYFFISNNRYFNVKLFAKDATVFYISQSINESKEINLNISKQESIIFSHSYLKEKLNSLFNYLSFDENYTVISSDIENIVNYKFRYNINLPKEKNNPFSSIYVTINTKYMAIQEIYLL